MDSKHLNPWKSITNTESILFVVQQEQEGKIYRGTKIELAANDRIHDALYYQIVSEGGSKTVSLELGINRSAQIADPEFIGHITPGFNFPMKDGVKNYPVLTVWVDYSNPNTLDISVSLADYLKLENPKNRGQMRETLEVIRSAIYEIDDSIWSIPDIESIKRNLIELTGLNKSGDMKTTTERPSQTGESAKILEFKRD